MDALVWGLIGLYKIAMTILEIKEININLLSVPAGGKATKVDAFNCSGRGGPAESNTPAGRSAGN
jgi:hypothetical protein